MNEAIETDQAAAMMAIFEEVRAFSNDLAFYSWGHADIVRMALITAAHRPFLPERCRCGTVDVRARERRRGNDGS
jgi:hypothetical protein